MASEQMSKDSNNKYVLPFTLTTANKNKTIVLDTENKFTDADIHIELDTPDAAATLNLNDINTAITMGTASSGVYTPTANFSGTLNVSTAGWISGTPNVSDSNVKIGKVNQSTLSKNSTAIASGSTINPENSSQTISISEGYNVARTIVFGPVSAGPKATITSGSATINTLNYTYESTSGNFSISGSANVSAPTINTAGYIAAGDDATTTGTKNSNTNGAIVSASVAKITVGVNPTATNIKVSPVITRTAKPAADSWYDAASGAATTTKPTSSSSSAYVRVDAAAIAASTTVEGKVSVGGYGTTTNFGKDAAVTITGGSNSYTAYIPITNGSVTSGSALINSLSYTYQSQTNTFSVLGSGTVSPPTVNTAGYIGNGFGNKLSNSGAAQVSAIVAKIEGNTPLTGKIGAVKPIINVESVGINGVSDASEGVASTAAPSSGVYVAVRSSENIGTLTATPSITTSGYGTADEHGIIGSSTTVGATASDMTYIPIKIGAIVSGAGNAIISAPTWNDNSELFEIIATGTVDSPSVVTEGYLSNTIGQKTPNNITGSASITPITLSAIFEGNTFTNRPSIRRTAKPAADTWVDAASGAATTTKPTSGAYVRVDTSSSTSQLTLIPVVVNAGYGTVDHYSVENSDIDIGYDPAISTYIPITAGAVTSGSATISSLTYTYEAGSGNTLDHFNITGSANVSAPTYTAGYISSTVGTKNANANGAVVNASVRAVELKVVMSGNGVVTPVISKTNATNCNAVGTATITQPASGYYIAVQSAENKTSVSASPQVKTAGYGTPEHTAPSVTNVTQTGANASAVTYIPITSTSFANTATTGVTYTDISSTAPILISGSYLFINEGYTPNVKISLAKLVPDATGTNASAQYILSGYTAFNNDGGLITGTMQTYDGSYTVT